MARLPEPVAADGRGHHHRFIGGFESTLWPGHDVDCFGTTGHDRRPSADLRAPPPCPCSISPTKTLEYLAAGLSPTLDEEVMG